MSPGLRHRNLRVGILSSMYLRYASDTRGLSVQEIAHNLMTRGVKPFVVAPHCDGYTTHDMINGVPVFRFRYFWPTSLQRLAYGAGMPTNLRKSLLARVQLPLLTAAFMLQTLRYSARCDILHAQWSLPGFVAVATKFIHRKPVVLTERRVVSENRFMRALNKFIYRNCNHVFFNSSFTQQEVLKISAPKSSSVVRPTINASKFAPRSSAKLKAQLGISKSARVILSMGLLVEKKGFRYLLEAMPKIREANDDVILVIVGGGALRKDLEMLASKLGVQDCVRFVGQVDADVTPQYFNMADVFVLASIVDSKGETETLGVVLLEAMASEVPVVASRVGGIPDVVTAKVGFLIPPKDSSAIASHVLKILRDEKLAKRLAKEGRKRAREVFTGAKAADEIMEMYGVVLNE